MQSVKSCFNPTLYKKNLSRFWPIWGLYALLWLFLLPIGILNETRWWDMGTANTRPLDYLDGFGIGIVSAVFFAILTAMAVFSYLYNSRSVGLFHALPLRREGLFFTNYLSGLSFLVLPNAAVFLLSLAAEAMAGAVNAGSLLMWLVVQSLLCFFFYSFAVFCAMFTGHILALPAFYFILNFLAAGLAYLFNAMAQSFLYGFVQADGMMRVANWLTPVFKLSGAMDLSFSDGDRLTARFQGLHIVLLYALVGVVLTALALVAYRRRHLESAGDVVSVPWVRPVFKYGVAACFAVALGLFLYSIFAYSLSESAWALLFFMLLSGAAGYFLAEMLLRKSFWVFRKSWKGCLVLLACLVAAMCVMEFDLTGFERRIPSLDAVERVQFTNISSAPHDDLDYTYFDLSDPEELARVAQLHQSIIDHKDAAESAERVGWMGERRDGLDVQTEGGTSLEILYTLKSGGYVERRYWVPVSWETLQDPASPDTLLTALINDPGLLERTYLRNWYEDHRLVNAVVNNAYDPASGEYRDVFVDSADLDDLFAAVRADLQSGDLGRRYLLEDADRLENCCYSDLTLTFYVPKDTQTDHPYNMDTETRTYTVTITLQKSAQRTLAVLEQSGAVGEDSVLLTQAEVRRLPQPEADRVEEYGYTAADTAVR